MTRASQLFVVLSVSTALLISGRSARADGPAPNATNLSPAVVAPKDAPSTDAAVASSATESAAQAAYQKAIAAYSSGDTRGALEGMRESYGLSGRPELLYNLARLEREQHHCLAALEAYRQYLERVPQGKYREPAQGALNELAQECPSSPPEEAPTPPNPVAANGAKPAPVSPPPRTQPAYWSRTRVLGWAAVSAGALSGGAALYFAQAARRARDDVQHNVELVKKGRALWNQARQDDQNRDDALAQVLGVSAGGLIAGGLVALLVSAPPTAPPSVAVWVEPGGLEASYSGSF